jgi:hypothetical protein
MVIPRRSGGIIILGSVWTEPDLDIGINWAATDYVSSGIRGHELIDEHVPKGLGRG